MEYTVSSDLSNKCAPDNGGEDLPSSIPEILNVFRYFLDFPVLQRMLYIQRDLESKAMKTWETGGFLTEILCSLIKVKTKMKPELAEEWIWANFRH